MSAKKNFLDFTMNAINVDSKNTDNIITSHTLMSENSFSDSRVSPTISSSNSINKIQQGESSKFLSVNHHEYNNVDTYHGIYNKLQEKKPHISQDLLNFSSKITIEKIVAEKKEFELVKDRDGINSIDQTKILTTDTGSFIYKFDKNIGEDFPEPTNEVKKKSNDSYIRLSKGTSKKGKKGVDSLLEKLESFSKKPYNSDNLNLPVIIHNIEDKDAGSVKSLSPEYYKSRSPNNRESDVVSPNFSNDDSNDIKQRRKKRKLGKPIRLAKDYKSGQEDSEFEITKTKVSTKSEISYFALDSNKKSFSEDSLLSVPEHENAIQKRHFHILKKPALESCPIIIKQKESILPMSEPNMKNTPLYSNRLKGSKFMRRLNELNDKKVSKCYEIENNSDFAPQLRDTRFTRSRRNSECLVTTLSKTKKKRRKSCDDMKELLHEAAPKTGVTNNIDFSEVESQLEKMFAGLIESDKDLKKSLLETEEKPSIISDNEQKENCNSDKEKSKGSSDNYCKKEKTKSIPKIRTYRRKSKKALKGIDYTSFKHSRKNSKKKLACKTSLKKSNILKNKKKCIKPDACREITYDSLVNAITQKNRSPVIQIKGSKTTPTCFQIVNNIREDDEEKNKEKRKVLGNCFTVRSKRLNYQNNLDFRGKCFLYFNVYINGIELVSFIL